MDPTKIYPTPEQPGLNHTKNAPNPETVNSPPGTPIKHLRPIDYLKLIGLGVFVSVSVYIVFFLILAVILANFVFGMIFIGAGGHILALAAVFIGYYAFTSYNMAGWGVFGSKKIAFSACLLVAAMVSMNIRLQSSLGFGKLILASPDAITVLGVPARIVVPMTFIISALSFAIMALIVDRISSSKLSTAIIISVPIIAFIGLTLGYKGSDEIIRLNPLIADHTEFEGTTLNKWLIRPSYTISGSVLGNNCEVADTAYGYKCNYSFEDYPGYLSEKTQAKIAALQKQFNTDTDYSPINFLNIVVAKHNPSWDVFFSEDKKSCDLFNSVKVTGPEYYGKPANTEWSKMEKCESFTTNGGRIVYFASADEYKDNPDFIATVPTRYYFQLDDTDVLISFDMSNYPASNKWGSLYFEDENFSQEVEKFIDSFNYVK